MVAQTYIQGHSAFDIKASLAVKKMEIILVHLFLTGWWVHFWFNKEMQGSSVLHLNIQGR